MLCYKRQDLQPSQLYNLNAVAEWTSAVSVLVMKTRTIKIAMHHLQMTRISPPFNPQLIKNLFLRASVTDDNGQ